MRRRQDTDSETDSDTESDIDSETDSRQDKKGNGWYAARRADAMRTLRVLPPCALAAA